MTRQGTIAQQDGVSGVLAPVAGSGCVATRVLGTTEALRELRALAAGLGPGDYARLLERTSQADEPEALRAALTLLGAVALLTDLARAASPTHEGLHP